MSKGTLIVLHRLLPHNSLANESAKSRPAHTLHLIITPFLASLEAQLTDAETTQR
ncbi:MAG: hypothetical protein ACR2G5_03945 [Pyrinomonadaceae bacterium]